MGLLAFAIGRSVGFVVGNCWYVGMGAGEMVGGECLGAGWTDGVEVEQNRWS